MTLSRARSVCDDRDLEPAGVLHVERLLALVQQPIRYEPPSVAPVPGGRSRLVGGSNRPG